MAQAAVEKGRTCNSNVLSFKTGARGRGGCMGLVWITSGYHIMQDQGRSKSMAQAVVDKGRTCHVNALSFKPYGTWHISGVARIASRCSI